MVRKLLFSLIITIFILSLVEVDPLHAGSNYQITIESARIASNKADGRKWDVYPRDPDPFVKVFIGGNLVLQTSVQQNTYSPSWHERVKVSYKKGVSFRIEVWDKDAMSDDLIGIWEDTELPEEPLSFGQVSSLNLSIQ